VGETANYSQLHFSEVKSPHAARWQHYNYRPKLPDLQPITCIF